MAQIEGLFISQDYIKNNTEIDENVNVKKLLPVVWRCQRLYIERVLGTALYDDLVGKIAPTDTLSGNDLILVEKYISPALVNWVMFAAQTSMLFSFRDKAVSKDSSDYAQPIDYTEHRYLKDEYKKFAEELTDRLEKYLCANSSLFPLYMSATSSDQIISTNIPPSGGLYIPDGDTEEDYYKCKFYYGQ
jgi:hypothetical protein